MDLSVGQSETISVSSACTLIISENHGAILGGVIYKRLSELVIIKAQYISVSESGSEALLMYSKTSESVTLKNNFTNDMHVSVVVIS